MRRLVDAEIESPYIIVLDMYISFFYKVVRVFVSFS